MNNFTVTDFVNLIYALTIWLVVSFVQGFALAYASNVLGFRSCSFVKQLALAEVLSLSVIPCLYYLLGRAFGLKATIIINGGLLITSAVILIRQKYQLRLLKGPLLTEFETNKLHLLAIAIWLVLSTTMLIDVQVNDKLFLNLTMFDHSLKVAFADAINRTGLPPSSPWFYPGHPVKAQYHYYWPLLCAVISSIAGSPYDTRMAVIAGVLWTGVTFLAFLGLYSSYFRAKHAPWHKTTIFMLALLLVSNLYILEVLPFNLLLQAKHHIIGCASIGWLAVDEVTAIITSMLWVPHHIAGLVAGMFGSILLLQASLAINRRERVIHVILAGICFASNIGLSVYTAICFILTWITWALVSLCQRRLLEFAQISSAGVICCLLSFPLLMEFAQCQNINTPLTFTVRSGIVYLLNLPRTLYLPISVLALPVNYLLGFGFLLVGACIYWEERLHSQGSIEKKEWFLTLLTCISMLLGSFVGNKFYKNDFGARILMPAGLVFLLWSARYLCMKWKDKKLVGLSTFNWLLIGIGVGTCIYGLWLDRTSPGFSHNANRTLAIRSMYETANKKLPLPYVLQSNPNPNEFFGIELYGHLYSHRQVVISTSMHDPIFLKTFGAIPSEVESLFGNPPLAKAIDICHRCKLDAILVKDTDRIWTNKSAWIWQFPVIAANQYCRLFLVRDSRD